MLLDVMVIVPIGQTAALNKIGEIKCNFYIGYLKMIKRLLILLILLVAVSAHGATYNFYFSSGATGNATGTDTAVALTDCVGPAGTASGTCSTISHVNTMINLAASDDIVYIWFDRGDTWTADTEALASSGSVIAVWSYDPTVHFNAYGTGALPIFDG